MLSNVENSNDSAVVFRGVNKAYAETTVLQDLTLSLPAGQTTVIVGASGSGKTTLLQLINGLERPDAGEVHVLGQPIPTDNLQPLRLRIGYAVQGAGLFPHLSAEENVTLVAGLAGWSQSAMSSRCGELMAAMELSSDIAQRLPRQLSGGQQQRLGLCRALMLNPEILLLDEPFSAVDAVTRMGLYECFAGVTAGPNVTSVLVTHDLREARLLADFLVILDQGRVVQSGLPDKVLANPETDFVERLIASQLS